MRSNICALSAEGTAPPPKSGAEGRALNAVALLPLVAVAEEEEEEEDRNPLISKLLLF